MVGFVVYQEVSEKDPLGGWQSNIILAVHRQFLKGKLRIARSLRRPDIRKLSPVPGLPIPADRLARGGTPYERYH